MNKFIIMSCTIACITLLSGCRHKDFCYHHPHGDIFVEVEYDDDNDQDDITYLRDVVTATRIHAYHQASTQKVLATDITRATNILPLESETYHFIAHNAGTQSYSFSSSDSFYDHEVTTRECDILEPLYGSRAVSSDIDLGNGEKVLIPSEPLWSIGGESVECNLGDTVRLQAIPLHCRYTYEMRNVEGLNRVARMSSFITGMSRGASMSSTELHDTPVTIAVSASADADNKSIVGGFLCFGQNSRINTRHRMGLFVELTTGEKYKILEGEKFDVTEQVVNAPNRRRVHIIIDGIKIPTPGNGTGFEVHVDPWGDGEDDDIKFDF